MTSKDDAKTPAGDAEQGRSSGATHDLLVAKLRPCDDRPNILILLTAHQREDTIRAAALPPDTPCFCEHLLNEADSALNFAPPARPGGTQRSGVRPT